MKKLLTILFVLATVSCFSQSFFQRSLPTVTSVDARLKASLNFYMPLVSDTTDALNGGRDTLGALILVKFGALRGVWFRDTVIAGGHLWVKIISSLENYWQLSGVGLYPIDNSYNVGIGGVPAFQFDVQNSGGGRLYFDGTRIGVYDNSSRNNILMGVLSGATLGSSTDNIAIGASSQRFVVGSRNVAVGTSSLQSANGSNNVSIGYQSMTLTDSSNNTGLGYTAGIANYGKQNISIGSGSGNYSQIGSAAVNNSEIVISTSNYSGATTASFITAQSLSIGIKYSFSLTFNGTAPQPYLASGITGLYINGTVTDASTIHFDGSTFTTQGTSTTTIALFNKQNNSIAIGYNAMTDSSNQIVLGNSSSSILKANQFVVDIMDVPTMGEVLVWDGTKAVWDTITGGGGGSYSFLSPLVNTAGVISIQNAAADGSTKGAATFTASDFNATSGNISIDYINGQPADATHKGFLTNGDWNTFNGKISNATGLITAGTNVTISGSGTSGSPYVINSSGSGSGGISSLNGLTGATQTFATGTSGTDFAISSSGTVHTFNLPIVSASNTGKVTPTLYNLWNAKADAATGAITTAYSSNLTASRAVISNGSGKLDVSTATSSDLTLLPLQYTSQALTDGATITMNCSSGYVGTVTLGGSRNITFSNFTAWHTVRIKFTQDGTGGRTVTFPASTFIPMGFGTGTQLTLSTGAAQIDWVYVDFDGTNYWVTIAKNFVH